MHTTAALTMINDRSRGEDAAKAAGDMPTALQERWRRPSAAKLSICERGY